MLKCSECEVFFFTVQGRKEHTALCIGYNPNPDAPTDNEFMTGLELREL